MKITLKDGKPASAEQIQIFEDTLGRPLSPSFKKFVETNDGARPESNTFKVSDTDGSGVSRFIPLEEIWKDRTYFEELPEKAYPVARAACGDRVAIDEGKNGAVFFLDHETGELLQLAPDFEAFLDMLETFDIRTVEFDRSKIEKVWVTPDFKERFKKYLIKPED